jgi:hypothetical protein
MLWQHVFQVLVCVLSAVRRVYECSEQTSRAYEDVSCPCGGRYQRRLLRAANIVSLSTDR